MDRRDGKIDINEVEAALKRTARTAVHGTREQRSGRFRSDDRTKVYGGSQTKPSSKGRSSKR